MKAIAVKPGRREVQLIEVPMPAIQTPRQARVRILDVGVCGTDREICSFQYGTPPDGCDFLVIGHESLGEVVEIGSAVKSLKPGDLVVTTVRRPCPHAECLACPVGRADFCYTGGFTERGIKQRHGFMTEFVVDDEQYMNPVPHSLRGTGVLVEPLTIAEKALDQIWSVQERAPWACPHIREAGVGHCHRALVPGAGPVGLLGAMALSNQGFQTYVYSREKAPNVKASIVEEIGAAYLPARDLSLDDLLQKMGDIDVVYEASGASALSFEVIQRLGPNGIFVFTGVPGRKAPVAVDTDRIMRNLVLNNQAVFGSVNAPRAAFQNAIRDLGVFHRRWPHAVAALITGRFPVSAYRELLLGPAQGIKNVVEFA